MGSSQQPNKRWEFTSRQAEDHENGSLSISEVAAQIAILCPGLIAKVWFEGFVVPRGSIFIAPPNRIEAFARHEYDPETVVPNLAQFDSALKGLAHKERQRFRLAARWYAQGYVAETLIDRLLSWYVSLEVFPTCGSAEVSGRVTEYIHKSVYPDVDAEELKRRILISGISKLRAKIVHAGKASVEDTTFPKYSRHLKALDAIVVTCLRTLAGWPAGSALDYLVRGPIAESRP